MMVGGVPRAEARPPLNFMIHAGPGKTTAPGYKSPQDTSVFSEIPNYTSVGVLERHGKITKVRIMMPPLWIRVNHLEPSGLDEGLWVTRAPQGSDTVPGYKSRGDTSVYYNVPNGISVVSTSNVSRVGGVAYLQADILLELYVPTNFVTPSY